MLPQSKEKLRNLMSKEMFFTPRWRMLELQIDILFTKEQIAYWQEFLANREGKTEMSEKLAKDLLEIEEKTLKTLLKQSSEI